MALWKERGNDFITVPIISLPFNFSVNNGDNEVMFLDFSFE